MVNVLPPEKVNPSEATPLERKEIPRRLVTPLTSGVNTPAVLALNVAYRSVGTDPADQFEPCVRLSAVGPPPPPSHAALGLPAVRSANPSPFITLFALAIAPASASRLIKFSSVPSVVVTIAEFRPRTVSSVSPFGFVHPWSNGLPESPTTSCTLGVPVRAVKIDAEVGSAPSNSWAERTVASPTRGLPLVVVDRPYASRLRPL